MNIFGLLGLLVAVAAIAYVWSRMSNEPGTMGDGTVGSLMDGGEDVRRIDLGTNTFIAQQAERELRDSGVSCRTVELESGAFGLGMGSHHYLVFNAGDEAAVTAVVDRLLIDLESDADEAHPDEGDFSPDA